MAGEMVPAAKRELAPYADIALGFATYRLTGQSALAGELVGLPSRVKDVLGVTPGVIAALDMIITVARVLTDDEDKRPFRERLDELTTWLPEFEDPQVSAFVNELKEKATRFAEGPDAKKKSERWLRHFTSASYLRVARRLLGAATFDRVRTAFDDDAAAVVVAFRRLTRHLTLTLQDQMVCRRVDERKCLPCKGFCDC